PGKPEFNYLRDADYISGASIMMPLKVWRQLGGFSIEFAPAYYEDTDFAMKVRAAGLRVLYQPLSRVVHHEGVTSGTDITSGVKRYQEVNKSTFLAKWQGVLTKHGKNADFRKSIVDRHAVGRILIFDAETPTPDKDSGSVTAFNYMRILSKLGYRVTFVPQNLLWCGRYSTDLQRMGVEVIHRPYATNSRDYLLTQAHDHDMIMLSRAPIGGKHIDDVRAAYPGKPIIFDTVDLHHLRVQRQYELEQRPELLDQANELKEIELNAIRKADNTILVSDYEVGYLEQQIGPFPHTIIPLIYEDYQPRNGFQDRRDFAFVGGYRHPPNVDAVNYLINEIWPRFRAFNTGAKLHIIGSHMPKEFEALACDDIIVTGFVADLEAYMENIRVSLAPLRYGAGVKGKVGNSLRMGVPVVATPVATEGMGLLDGEHILVGGNANEFAKKMLDVYSEREVWRKFSHRGQKQVCESYGLAAAEDRLTGLIAKLFKMSS
ncbi:MAG TPA: glycosyltransferase, partial [Terricaulis sp.]|nr:glycosyltransferase [Terricaulis sp.]